MESTEGYTLRFTAHAREQIEAKFSDDAVEYTFTNPERVYPNRKFPGQFRVTGHGVCIVGRPIIERRENIFLVFTVYEDGVMTPPRPDQIGTPEGDAYAVRYEKAIKAGKVKRDNEYWPRVHQRNGDMRHRLIK